MRRLSRFITWAVVVCVVLIIAVAMTNEPPEPFVRTDDFRATPYHLERVECVGGVEIHHFQRDDGRPMGSALTDYAC